MLTSMLWFMTVSISASSPVGCMVESSAANTDSDNTSVLLPGGSDGAFVEALSPRFGDNSPHTERSGRIASFGNQEEVCSFHSH